MAQAGPVSGHSARFPSLAKYEIQEELGHGGMATVYRAHDARLGRDVAIKVLHPHLRDNREIAHRFATEAKAVAKLRHPNIVEVFDVSEVGDGERYLVVELVRGATLRALVAERGPVPPEIAAAIALEVLAALSAAHGEGVVHRDVKPENVLMEHPHLRRRAAGESQSDSLVPRSNPNDTQLRIKLTDFGIAKMLDAQGVTSTGQVLGSPAHMAPEQIDGGDVDERADIFGVGVLLYECMVGHLPFEGANPAQVLRRVLEGVYSPAERERPIIGRDWSGIIDRALMLDPNARYASALAMREAIGAEFKRLGVEDPRADLEAYFADPEGYEAAHQEKLLAKLHELGAEARKRKDVQGAANAYNRALAYAPNDTQLLRVVATLARAEERRRMLRRFAPPFSLAVVLGLGAYGVTRALTAHPDLARPAAQPTTNSASVVVPVKSAPSAQPADVPPPFVKIPRVSATPSVAPPKKEPKTRTVTIVSTDPPAGVLCAVDTGASLSVSAGTVLPPMSDGAHELHFTCVNNMCDPQTVHIDASDRNESVSSVKMPIRPAVITVDGPASGSYGISQRPGTLLRAGVPTPVAMSAGTETFTVKELASGKSVTINGRAGASTTAVFTDLGP